MTYPCRENLQKPKKVEIRRPNTDFVDLSLRAHDSVLSRPLTSAQPSLRTLPSCPRSVTLCKEDNLHFPYRALDLPPVSLQLESAGLL